MRIAAIDLGSNGARLLLAEQMKGSGYRILARKRFSLRLGEDPFRHGEFRRKGRDSLFELLHSFEKMMEDEGVEACLFVGTSAFRDAQNTPALVEEVFKSFGYSINVIDGLKEGGLLVRGIQREVSCKGPFLVIDIGGGSTEMAVVHGQKTLKLISLDVGTVRPLNEKSIFFLKKKMAETIIPLLGEREPVLVVGTGGNLRRMGKLKKTMLKKENISSLKPTHFETIVDHLLESSHSERVEKFGLQ